MNGAWGMVRPCGNARADRTWERGQAIAYGDALNFLFPGALRRRRNRKFNLYLSDAIEGMSPLFLSASESLATHYPHVTLR
ncbi:MAG: hypothetical protein KatS3mg054_0760 [Chloroflexus sp.]|jgi:hypothetical protein|nr:MAG: hypothetical protein KatS3mg054_0760 [Chloroflexus sp.]